MEVTRHVLQQPHASNTADDKGQRPTQNRAAHGQHFRDSGAGGGVTGEWVPSRCANWGIGAPGPQLHARSGSRSPVGFGRCPKTRNCWFSGVPTFVRVAVVDASKVRVCQVANRAHGHAK
eukprot:15038546-Alexandrium_andersonii.AAC.1